MCLLIIALGSVGQGIAERLSDLVAGCFEEQISYSFINTDYRSEARLVSHRTIHTHQSAVMVPIKSLLGEAFAPSIPQDTSDTHDAPHRFSPIHLDEMMGLSSERVAHAIRSSVKRGGLFELERKLDKALYVGRRQAGDLRIALVGAACDPLVAGGAPVLLDHLVAYVQERYSQALSRVLLLALSTDSVVDTLRRREDRDRLREQEAKLVEAMRTRIDGKREQAVDKYDEVGQQQSVLTSTCILPVTNSAGKRFASVEDYCQLAAGMLMAEVSGIWQNSLFEYGLSCGRGVAFIEYPDAQIRRYVRIGLARDAISWWNHVDDLWLAGGWEDFGLGDEDRGEFYRNEVRRLARRTKHQEIADCMRHLDEAFASATLVDEAAGLGQKCDAEQQIASNALRALVDVAAQQLDKWELKGAREALGCPLSVLRTLPQTIGDVQEAARVCGTDEALVRHWAISFDALERRYGIIDRLETYILSEMDALVAKRSFGLAELGLPAYLDDLHPIAVRTVLYAYKEAVAEAIKRTGEQAGQLRCQIAKTLSDETDLNATIDGVQTLRDSITLDDSNATDSSTVHGLDDVDQWNASIARLAGIGYLLNATALRMRELEAATAKYAVLVKAEFYLSTLSRRYERFFMSVQRLEHRLDEEMRGLEIEMASQPGSIRKMIRTDLSSLEMVMARCKESIDGYPVGYIIWRPIHRSLRIRTQGSLMVWESRAASRLVDEEDADAEHLRSILLKRWEGLGGRSAIVHDSIDSDIVSVLSDMRKSVPEDKKRFARISVLEEAYGLATPFCTQPVSDETIDTLVTGKSEREGALRNAFVQNRYIEIGEMDSHRLIVCRESSR